DARVCPHLHLPFQAGSNRILDLMNRGYTREKYLEIVSRARDAVPDLALSTDIIVGFPSESGKEFEETLEIVEKARFDSAFTFKYSPRQGTAAAGMEDSVPAEVKKERLNVLNGKIRAMRKDILQNQLGRRVEILLDGRTKKEEYLFWKGRTPHFRNVLLPGDYFRDGDIVPVVLKKLRNFTFVGEETARR
ncbi:MAG: radical SAM protein, partial [Candidatus Krumholzibacteriota bacterium]|nr:radical SAM protein [Candidatus Krumholzibacteriota bacterium]